MIFTKSIRCFSILIQFVACAILCGCATSIRYTSRTAAVSQQGTLRAAVYDFHDATDGAHGFAWHNGYRFDNHGKVFADVTAAVLNHSGQFRTIDRIRREMQQDSTGKPDYDVLVSGEISKLRSGKIVHPTVFINPICIPAIFGIPSGYGTYRGNGQLHVDFRSSSGASPSETLYVDFSDPEHSHWGSLPSTQSDFAKGGSRLVNAYENELLKKWRGASEGTLAKLGGHVARHPAPLLESAISGPQGGIMGNAVADRWAVIVGISNYADSRVPSLRYGASDARAFYDWTVHPSGGKYAPARVKLLLNKQATCENIKDALFVWLKRALSEDMIIIYFAGHGSPESPGSPDNLFLLPYDARYDSLSTTGFPMWDIETALKRYIKAKKVVVIADACHSGGVGHSFDIARRANRGLKVNPISAGMQTLTKVGDGVCVISASDENQFSQESKNWGGGHGVFTYFLLQGLKGDADYNKDTSVTLGELTSYLSQEVRRATKNAQSPTVAGRYDPALTIGK